MHAGWRGTCSCSGDLVGIVRGRARGVHACVLAGTSGRSGVRRGRGGHAPGRARGAADMDAAAQEGAGRDDDGAAGHALACAQRA
jgi:hypothetical protein